MPAQVASVVMRFRPPADSLSTFVDRFWSWESPVPCELPLLLPGIGAECLFHFGSPPLVRENDGTEWRLPQAHFFCLRTRSCKLVAEGPVGFVSVRFRGSGARYFGALGMHELRDDFRPARESLGEGTEELCARLARETTFAARALLVEHFLLARFKAPTSEQLRADLLIDRLYYSPEGESIAAIADRLGFSARQVERIVGRHAGMTPKVFRRVSRMHHVMRDLFVSGRIDYLDTALSRGYYDQSHFVHEVRELTGKAPLQVLAPENRMSHFYNTSLRS